MQRLALFFSGLLLCLGSPTHVLWATDHHVSPTGSDTTGDGSAGNPWRTISHALGVAILGDTVRVAAGTYDLAAGESFPITIGNGVQLIGPLIGTAALDATGAASEAITIGATTATTRIENLQVTGDGVGFPVISLAGPQSDLELIDNALLGGDQAIRRPLGSSGAVTAEIRGNAMQGAGSFAVHWSADEADRLILAQNTISGYTDGIQIEALSAVVDATIEANSLSAGSDGLRLQAFAAGSTPASLTGVVEGNTIHSCGDDGIHIAISDSSTVADVSFDMAVCNNSITANGGDGFYASLFRFSGSVRLAGSLTGNTITSNAGQGVHLLSSSSSVQVDLELGGGLAAARGRNSLASNADMDVRLAVADDVPARGNWWEAGDSAGIEARVFHRPDFANSGTLDFTGFASDPIGFQLQPDPIDPGQNGRVTADVGSAFVPNAGTTNIQVLVGGQPATQVVVAADGSLLDFTMPTQVSGGTRVLSITNPGGQNGSSAITVSGSTPGVGGENESEGGGGGGGCFLATAAYGDYQAPEVRWFRRWREQSLSESPIGRRLVAAYYEASPVCAELVADHPALRGLSRVLLAPVLGGVRLWLDAAWVYGLLVVAWIAWRLRIDRRVWKRRMA